MTDRRPILAKQLFTEWNHLRHHRPSLLQAAGWQVVETQLDDLEQVLTAIGFGVAATADTESAMRALVTQAANDELATRVVVQRLMPGLIATSRVRHRRDNEAFAELFGAAWIAIRSYSPTRQPACLAAALVREADDQAFRRGWRRRRFEESQLQPWQLEQPESDVQDTPADELDWVIQRAVAAGLTAERLDDLRRFASGRPTDELATEMRISPRAVRYRRNNVTREIRELLAVPAA